MTPQPLLPALDAFRAHPTDHDLPEVVATARAHLRRDSGVEEWRVNPGLEPVWLTMLSELGQVT